jgi:hypothetical protein
MFFPSARGARPWAWAASKKFCHKLGISVSRYLCVSARQIFDGSKTEKPPAFTGGFGLDAIRELGVLYTTTVTPVKQLFLN